jgi:head-tail adaptor
MTQKRKDVSRISEQSSITVSELLQASIQLQISIQSEVKWLIRLGVLTFLVAITAFSIMVAPYTGSVIEILMHIFGK